MPKGRKTVFSKTVVVNKPVDIAFGFVSHHPNHKEIFGANVESIQVTDGPMNVGTIVQNKAKFLGTTMTERFKIIRFEKNKVIEKTSLPDSTHETSDTFTFKDLGNGKTEITLEVIAYVTGFMRVIYPITVGMLKKILSKDTDRLKELIDKL